MCRWLAYSGAPVLLEELLYKPKNSLVDAEPALAAGGGDHERGRLRRRVVRDERDAGGVPEHRAGVERPQPPRARRACQVTEGARAHPRIHRLPGPADELPSVPPRQLAVHAQRLIGGLPYGRRDLALGVDPALYPRDRGHDRHRAALLPRPDLRAGRRPARGRGPGRRLRRGDRPAPRRGVPDPDDRGDDRRRGPWAFRYSSEGRSRSLFHSADVSTLRASTRTTAILDSSPTTRVSSSPSRWGTCAEPGRRCRNPTCVTIQRGPGGAAPFTPGPSGRRSRHDSGGPVPRGAEVCACRRDSGRRAGPGGGSWSCSRRARRASWSPRCRGSCSWSGRGRRRRRLLRGIPAVHRGGFRAVGGRRSTPGPAGRGGSGREQPRRLDWWSGGLQLLGTLAFNVTTFRASAGHGRAVLRPARLAAGRGRLGLLPRLRVSRLRAGLRRRARAGHPAPGTAASPR